MDDLSVLRSLIFTAALNDLDELLNQSGKAFLIGAGCGQCAGLPLTAELTATSLSSPTLDATTKIILSAIQKQFDGAAISNIEDYLSELVDLVAIAERRTNRGATSKTATLEGVDYTAKQLKDGVDQIKKAMAETIDKDVTIKTHCEFIKAVHKPLRPGRSNLTERPVDYLILNYDTLIENALALEKLRYADGMCGGNSAWWDINTFHSNDLAARVLKLHGSIDWTEIAEEALPRRISKKLKLDGINDQRVMIWPASTKYRETQRDPYAQLINLSRSVLRPKAGFQTVLIVCGYSFGDTHVNVEIERALRESGGELTVVIFTNDESPSGELKKWHEDKAITEQVRIYARKGFFHGTIIEKSTVDLPWWKFENITRLLGGER